MQELWKKEEIHNEVKIFFFNASFLEINAIISI